MKLRNTLYVLVLAAFVYAALLFPITIDSYSCYLPMYVVPDILGTADEHRNITIIYSGDSNNEFETGPVDLSYELPFETILAYYDLPGTIKVLSRRNFFMEPYFEVDWEPDSGFLHDFYDDFYAASSIWDSGPIPAELRVRVSPEDNSYRWGSINEVFDVEVLDPSIACPGGKLPSKFISTIGFNWDFNSYRTFDFHIRGSIRDKEFFVFFGENISYGHDLARASGWFTLPLAPLNSLMVTAWESGNIQKSLSDVQNIDFQFTQLEDFAGLSQVGSITQSTYHPEENIEALKTIANGLVLRKALVGGDYGFVESWSNQITATVPADYYVSQQCERKVKGFAMHVPIYGVECTTIKTLHEKGTSFVVDLTGLDFYKVR